MTTAGNLWRRWLNRLRQKAGAKANNSRRHARPTVEALEQRTVPSIYDGSFQAIHLTDLRNDPTLSALASVGTAPSGAEQTVRALIAPCPPYKSAGPDSPAH